MFRGVTTGGRLAKYLAAPALVVQRAGLLWAHSPDDRYLAEDEQWSDADVDGVIADRGGMVMVDRDSELARPAAARSLRVHELGHALGTSHVTSRLSFMSPDGAGGLPNESDREAFRVAARRPPGSRSPDVDPANFTLNVLAQFRIDLARPLAGRPTHRGMSTLSTRNALELFEPVLHDDDLGRLWTGSR